MIFRSDESGTTDNFQKYLTAASDGAWEKGAGKTFNGGAGEGAKGNSIEAMDLGFMLQCLSLDRVNGAPESLMLGPQAVPVDINRTIASRMVADFSVDA